MKKKELHQVFASLTKVADATNKTNWQLMSIDNLAGDIIINITGLINQKIAHICQSLKNLANTSVYHGHVYHPYLTNYHALNKKRLFCLCHQTHGHMAFPHDRASLNPHILSLLSTIKQIQMTKLILDEFASTTKLYTI